MKQIIIVMLVLLLASLSSCNKDEPVYDPMDQTEFEQTFEDTYYYAKFDKGICNFYVTQNDDTKHYEFTYKVVNINGVYDIQYTSKTPSKFELCGDTKEIYVTNTISKFQILILNLEKL